MVGLYLLNDLGKITEANCIGLYRDDGLMITNKSKCDQERIGKKLRTIFKNHGFSITIDKGLFLTDFLDIKLNLRDGTYEPFRKENAAIKYINNQSNHPRNIRRDINPMINRRISSLSCNIHVYNDRVKPYNTALRNSGFDDLKGYMNPEHIKTAKKKRRRTRKIIYFNPPFCNSVRTKIGKQFFNLISMHFPRGSKLAKIFNKNTIKLSYSCLPNMKNIINSHNRKILKKKNSLTKYCNCREKFKCPFNGECLSKGIYKATIYCKNGYKEYIGSTGVSFKSRYNQHMHSLNSNRSNQTSLSIFTKEIRTKSLISNGQFCIRSKEIFQKGATNAQYVTWKEWLLPKWTEKDHSISGMN